MRYQQLDFLRGLCLLDMVIVHLIVFIPQIYFESLVQMTNFSAEGFFLISGIMVGLIHYPRFLESPRGASLSLTKKAFLMLGIHIATILSFMLIYHLMGIITIDSFSSLIHILGRLVSFEKVYHLTNILYLFFLFFSISPVIMAGYRRFGWRPILAISTLALFFGFWKPLTFFISYPDFPIITWQFVFVAGFLLGVSYPDWKEKKIPLSSMIASLALFILLFALRFQEYLGFTFFPDFFRLLFKKFPLHPGLLLYVGLLLLFIFRAVHRHWGTIPEKAKDFVSSFGAYSLVAFIAHMHLDFFIHKADEAGWFDGFIVKTLVVMIEIIIIYLCIKGYERIVQNVKCYRRAKE